MMGQTHFPDVPDDIPADADFVILSTGKLVLYNENKKADDFLLKE